MQSLRERIVVVPQEGFLFAGTLRDNVRVGRPEATDDEVDAALVALGLFDRFHAFPDGLETEVRERGSRLSAGERQLVSLARAALADPTILVLDEATSNLDPGTEHQVESRARAADARPHGRRGRAPAVDRRARRSHRRRLRRRASPSSAPTPSSSPSTATTRACTARGRPTTPNPRRIPALALDCVSRNRRDVRSRQSAGRGVAFHGLGFLEGVVGTLRALELGRHGVGDAGGSGPSGSTGTVSG